MFKIGALKGNILLNSTLNFISRIFEKNSYILEKKLDFNFNG
jgi:hypothetical protein